MIRNNSTNPVICVATAMMIVSRIDTKYTIDGMILCFFFMSLQWPAGVDRKHVPAMLRIWPIEQRIAQATTSKALKTKISDTMKDSTIPTIEQISQPKILVLQDRSPQRVLSEPKENMLFSSFQLFPQSNAFPIVSKLLWIKSKVTKLMSQSATVDSCNPSNFHDRTSLSTSTQLSPNPILPIPSILLPLISYLNPLMGVTICNSYIQNSEVGEFQPIMSTFNPITASIQIQPQHRLLFDKIKSKFDVVDCRKKQDLNWYESPKYNLYLYGNVSRDRPIGDCFFYIKDSSVASTPIIITTSVNDHYIYSQNTLIVYPDNVIYYGSIRNNIATLPRAEGQGLLLSPEFVYRGEFKNGYPHGYGSYRSKNLEYVGVFKNGEPFGECIQKSSNKLFIGSIQEDGSKRGVVINKHNQKTIVDEKEPLHQSKLSLRSYMKE